MRASVVSRKTCGVPVRFTLRMECNNSRHDVVRSCGTGVVAILRRPMRSAGKAGEQPGGRTTVTKPLYLSQALDYLRLHHKAEGEACAFRSLCRFPHPRNLDFVAGMPVQDGVEVGGARIPARDVGEKRALRAHNREGTTLCDKLLLHCLRCGVVGKNLGLYRTFLCVLLEGFHGCHTLRVACRQLSILCRLAQFALCRVELFFQDAQTAFPLRNSGRFPCLLLTFPLSNRGRKGSKNRRFPVARVCDGNEHPMDRFGVVKRGYVDDVLATGGSAHGAQCDQGGEVRWRLGLTGEALDSTRAC